MCKLHSLGKHSVTPLPMTQLPPSPGTPITIATRLADENNQRSKCTFCLVAVVNGREFPGGRSDAPDVFQGAS